MGFFADILRDARTRSVPAASSLESGTPWESELSGPPDTPAAPPGLAPPEAYPADGLTGLPFTGSVIPSPAGEVAGPSDSPSSGPDVQDAGPRSPAAESARATAAPSPGVHDAGAHHRPPGLRIPTPPEGDRVPGVKPEAGRERSSGAVDRREAPQKEWHSDGSESSSRSEMTTRARSGARQAGTHPVIAEPHPASLPLGSGYSPAATSPPGASTEAASQPRTPPPGRGPMPEDVRQPRAAAPEPPRVHIGQVDVVVNAPPEPRPSRQARQAAGLASRLYLRGL